MALVTQKNIPQSGQIDKDGYPNPSLGDSFIQNNLTTPPAQGGVDDFGNPTLGDSFIQGACVNESDTIAGNLRSKVNNESGVLNLGLGGNGPLLQYVILREYVNKIQRNLVNNKFKDNYFVIDGRDIGSVVFKGADLKLYIDVTEENRAKRRYKQLIDSGEKSIYRKILKEITLRDQKDKVRKHSPLIIPKGAYIIDNNGTFNKTVKQINKLIEII